MLQLLIRNTVTDPAKWKEVYDAHSEDRSNAGLGQLQIWADVSDPNTIWGLYSVTDQTRAQDHLDDAKTKMVSDRAGVQSSEHHFLKTA